MKVALNVSALMMVVYVCLLLGLLCGLQHSQADDDIDKYNVRRMEEQLCFLTAVSSNHLHTANGFLKSIQKFYPCAKTYVYDLGLKKHEKKLLRALPYVEDVMELILPVRNKDYFPSGSCAFKPPMILQFIDKYLNNETDCRYFFYGDSVIFFHHKFNRKAFDEVIRHGIVAQTPRREDQISMTHPGMFPYFGFDREWLYKNQHKLGGPGTMKQVQAGLMLVDATNTTMRNSFFQEWADCAANDDCLIPDKIQINKRVGQPLAIHNISGRRVFRAHRDDQSAFSFLIAKYFGFGGHSIQRAYLDDYVGTYWRQTGSHQDLITAGENCSYSSRKFFMNATLSSNSSNISSFNKVHNHKPKKLLMSQHRLLLDLELIEAQAVFDFFLAVILAAFVGVLFVRWKRYWESDLHSS